MQRCRRDRAHRGIYIHLWRYGGLEPPRSATVPTSICASYGGEAVAQCHGGSAAWRLESIAAVQHSGSDAKAAGRWGAGAAARSSSMPHTRRGRQSDEEAECSGLMKMLDDGALKSERSNSRKCTRQVVFVESRPPGGRCRAGRLCC